MTSARSLSSSASQPGAPRGDHPTPRGIGGYAAIVATGRGRRPPARLIPACDHRTRSAPARPPSGAGLVALGSALAAGPARTVDCDGDRPSGGSQSCTAMQTALRGRTLAAPRDGVVRRWHVRGARGEVALRVIRRSGATSGWSAAAATSASTAASTRSRVDAPIRRGDLLGLELAPGSGGGFRGNGAGRDDDALRLRAALRPAARAEPVARHRSRRGAAAARRLRAWPGPRRPTRMTGAAAPRAPAGRRLAEREIDLEAVSL